MKMEPHNPELYFTVQLDFDYDESADYPVWGQFLRTSLVHPDGTPDPEMIQLLQEALGYSMTARTDMKASFWLMGKTDSGKSTLIAFIRSLMGNLNVTIDLNQLAGNRFLLAAVVGKRVVTFTEADSGIALPDALYKAMVGGEDALYSDVKNKEGISFVPEFKLWWAMNEAPRVLDRSGATINRLKVLLFNRSIPQDQQIIGLVQQLEKERAGVFNWIMKGYRQLVQRGKFTEPTQSAGWLANYRMENDTERTYLLEKLEMDAEMMIQSHFLYDDYRGWCEANGFKPKNANQVSKDWERLGLKKAHRNNGNFWQGARIKDSQKPIF
jgi:putative DNA primase/helicase